MSYVDYVFALISTIAGHVIDGKVSSSSDIMRYNTGNYKFIAEFLGQVQNDNIVEDSTYVSGKRRWSYGYPSFLSEFIKKINAKEVKGVDTEQRFNDFIKEEFEKYGDSYYDANNDRFHNEMLNLLTGRTVADWENSKKYRQIFAYKELLEYGEMEYNDQTNLNHLMTQLLEFFGTTLPDRETAWYAIPTLSNAPVNGFIHWKRYDHDKYREQITDKLRMAVIGEWNRIKNVEARKKYNAEAAERIDYNYKAAAEGREQLPHIQPLPEIQNYDRRGGLFISFPYFNEKDKDGNLRPHKNFYDFKAGNMSDTMFNLWLNETITNHIDEAFKKEMDYFR